VTVLLPGVTASKPVPVNVAVPASTSGSGVTDVTNSVVPVASKVTGEPTGTVAEASAV
jgi:hypothetical protein